MRKLLSGAVVAVVMLAGVAMPSTASAHVHGITPLNQITVDDANSGGKAAQGDPITGLIPRDVGEAPLTVGDGGFGATGDNAP